MCSLHGTAVPQELLVRYNKAGQIEGRTNLELPPIQQRVVEVRRRDGRMRTAAGKQAGRAPPSGSPRLAPLIPRFSLGERSAS